MSLVIPRKTALVDPATGFLSDLWERLFFRVLGGSYGTWFAVPYLAGHFSWTVQAGDQVTFAYCLMGKRLEVALVLRTTASGAVASGTVTIPGGYVAARDMTTPVVIDDNGTTSVGKARVSAGGTVITITRADGAALTDLRAVEGVCAMEVR